MQNDATQRLKQERRTIRKTIAILVIPLIIENVLSMLAGMVNSALLGNVDTIGLSSVFEVTVQGVGTSMTGLFWNLFRGLSITATVLIARADGEGEPWKIRHYMRYMLKAMFVLGLIGAVIMALGAPWFVKIYSLEADAELRALQYLRIAAMGMPALAMLQAVITSLQGKSNTRIPMVLSLFMNVVNIAMGYLLIYGGPIASLQNSLGAATAVVLSEYTAFGLGLLYLIFKERLLDKDPAPHSSVKELYMTRHLISLGIPSALETMSWRVATIALGRVILKIGMVAYTANNMGVQAEAITYMPAVGFGIAASTLTGKALGARDPELGRLTMKELMKGVLLAISVGTFILIFFPRPFMSLLSSDPEVIRLGAIYLFLMGLIQVPQNLTSTLIGAIKGAGNTFQPMLIAWIGLWGVRVIGSYLVFYLFNVGILGLWLVVCVDVLVRFALSVLLYRKQRIWG